MKDAPIQTAKASDRLKPSTQDAVTSTAKRDAKKPTKQRENIIDTVDLSTFDTDTNAHQGRSNRKKSAETQAAEPWFGRLFRRPAKDSNLFSVPISDDTSLHQLPLIDGFDEEESSGAKFAERKSSSGHGRVTELSDFQAADDFTQEPTFGHKVAESGNAERSNGLLDDNRERAEEITDEDLSILEGELTDYEQYINALDVCAAPGSGSDGLSSISKSAREKRSSQADNSTNSASTAPTIFSPVPVDGTSSLSSDSLFFQTPSVPPSSISKASHRLERVSGDEAHYRTPSKKRRIATSQGTVSPLRLNANPNTGLAAGQSTATATIDKEQSQHVDSKENVWESVDWSLLDEFKDFVNFY